MKKKIAVLCSGGVDSSVALHLLHSNSEYEITVFYLKIWLEDELSYLNECPWESDLSFVRATCENLQVPLKIIPLQKEYWQFVVGKSIEMIKSGYTPNPDIFCNSMIKFGAFLTFIGNDYDYIATGHYAHTIERHGWRYLVHTTDMIKDQTYFLSYTPYKNLSRVIFPLGIFTNKNEVREYATTHNLPSAARKDSQGICFLGKIPFEKFVEHHCGIKKGTLIEFETNKILGEHNGFWFFTIGQRQGIRLHGGPWYVIKKDIISNTVFISKQNPKVLDTPASRYLTIYNINFLVPEDEKMIPGKIYKIKIRHGQHFNQAKILFYTSNKTLNAEILHPDQGIACGQIIAFYSDENICLGSGIIGQ